MTELLAAGEGCDPLIELGKRWDSELATPVEDDGREDALHRAFDIEHEMAVLTPSSPEGALAQLRVVENMCIDDDWLDGCRALFNHVVAFLEGVAAAGG
jgi:hypothetical protein